MAVFDSPNVKAEDGELVDEDSPKARVGSSLEAEVLLPHRNPRADGSLLVLFAVPNANNEAAPVSAGAGAGAAGVPPNLKLAVSLVSVVLNADKSDLRGGTGEASFSALVPGVAGRGLMLAPNIVSFLSPELPKLKPLVPVLREKALPPPLPPVVGVLLPKLKASVPKLGVLGF